MSIKSAALALALVTSVSAAEAAEPSNCTVTEADIVCIEQGVSFYHHAPVLLCQLGVEDLQGMRIWRGAA